MNNLIVISGPSGSGKSTLIRRLLQKHGELVFSTSHTTRPRRKREIDGKDYHFVSKEQFQQMIGNDEFVEWALVYDNYYGTSYGEIESKTKESPNTFLVLDIDVQGAQNIKKKYQDALFIFIIPPTLEELEKRLVKREKKEDENVRKRLEIARLELKEYNIYDYIIINRDLGNAFYILDCIYAVSLNTKDKRAYYKAYQNTMSRRALFVEKLLQGDKE